MLSYFEDESVLYSFDFQSVQNRWDFSFELDVDDGTDDLGDLAFFEGGEPVRLAGCELEDVTSEH